MMSSLEPRSRRELLVCGVVILSGAVWGLCFGRTVPPWLGWVAMVPLLAWLAAGARRSRRLVFTVGLGHGFLAWMVSIPWIAPTLVVFGDLPEPLAWVLLGGLAIYLGLYHALFALLGERLLALRPGSMTWLLVLPALWVSIEWLRGHIPGFLAFPWNLAGYAWTDVLGALPASAWIGIYGVSFLVLAANCAIALGVRGRLDVAMAGILGLVLILLIAARWSRPAGEPRLLMAGGTGWDPAGQEVYIAQPNQDLLAKAPAEAWAAYQRLLDLSHAGCDGSSRLLIWPESAAWPYSWEVNPHLRDDIDELARRGCAVILNSPMAVPGGDGEFYNSALLVAPGGEVQRYDKRRLVPFGEYVPFERLLTFAGTLVRHVGRFTPGETAGLLDWEGERLAVSVCYETMFPELIAAQARAGATLLVTISNDAWYGDSSAPYQLFRAARFRAAETRRPHLRAALTGVSGRLGRRGEIEEKLALGERGALSGRVSGATERTPFMRAPWLVPSLCFGIALLGFLAARRVARGP